MEHSTLKGLNIALHFARCGRFIFAIKYIEKQNLGISREDAIAVVVSFGYREQSWHNDNELRGVGDESQVRVL
jgi:hypothetical protein